MNGIIAFVRDTRGAAAAEMVLMIPLLLVLMFGGFEAGHYFYNEHQVVKAVREGARYAGRLPFTTYDCDSGSIAMQTQIQEVTRTGQPSGGTARITGFTNDDITVQLTCDASFNGGLYNKLGTAPTVEVEATVAYPSLLGELGLFDDGLNVRAAAHAAVMGQ